MSWDPKDKGGNSVMSSTTVTITHQEAGYTTKHWSRTGILLFKLKCLGIIIKILEHFTKI